MSNYTPLNQLSISIACLLDEPNTITVTDIEHLQNCTTEVENFVEEVFQIAFGDNALNRDFSFKDVLNRLKKDDEDLYHYQNNTIVAYDRNQLDDAIGKESSEGMWELCQELIHNNEGAWSAMSDACAEAEDDIQHLIDEEEMNNA